jgi:hypothetical protein
LLNGFAIRSEGIIGFAVVVVGWGEIGDIDGLAVAMVGRFGLLEFETDKGGGVLAGGKGFEFGFSGGLEEFAGEVLAENMRGHAKGLGDGGVTEAEFGHGLDQSANVFVHVHRIVPGLSME